MTSDHESIIAFRERFRLAGKRFTPPRAIIAGQAPGIGVHGRCAHHGDSAR